MIIIHGMNDLQTLPRVSMQVLESTAKVLPAAVILGARQVGKSTLARQWGQGRDVTYITLDDFDALAQAREAPDALVARQDALILDEVQRAPGLLLAVKRAIDRDRRPGRYILTGSANLLLMHKVSESLAGRAAYLTLWPLSRGEQRGEGRAGLWSTLFETAPEAWLDVLVGAGSSESWADLARRGGYPTPAHELQDDAARTLWFSAYVSTYLERDLQELSVVASLVDFRRLMRAACLRLGQVVNQTELGRDVGLPQATVHRYLNLLEVSYQLVRLQPYAVNRTKRLIKSPKLYWTDTGLAMHLADARAPQGCHLENLVLCELLAWRETVPQRPEILYWRTATGDEVDFVIELAGRLLPIEVKATSKPTLADCKHLRTFQSEYGSSVLGGLLLHDGDFLGWMADGVLAAPWWTVC
jgi:predicted AAA+ superfamily ATPase